MSRYAKHERVRLLARPEMTEQGPRFLPGNPGGDRHKGSKNRIPLLVREAVVIAADELGSDGQGREGLVGWLKNLARRHPTTFAQLLGRLIPMEVAASLTVEDEPAAILSAEEVRRRLAKRGINVDLIFDGPAELLPPVTTNGSDKVH